MDLKIEKWASKYYVLLWKFTWTNVGDINDNESDSKENNEETDNNKFDMALV